MLKFIAIFLVVVASIFVAGCASKTTTTLNDTQGALEQVTPVAIPTPAMHTQVPEAQVAGLFIEFEDGTTESEVKAIVKAVLDNYNMTVNTIDYNYSIMPSRYYIIVDKAKIMDIRDELRKEEIWTDPAIADLKKGNYYIITVPEQIIHDKNFLMILGKNNLQVKKSVLCYICFGDGYKNGILVEDATRITDELKANKKVLIANPEGQAAGFLIQFEDGTTEPEVKAILENYNMTLNYSIDCNADNGGYKYYIKVQKDNLPDVVKDGLRKDENWTDPVLPYFTKGDYIIYPVTEQAIQDKNFLEILKRHNLQVKKFVWCLINFGDYPSNLVRGRYVFRMKYELETNEKILTVDPNYVVY